MPEVLPLQNKLMWSVVMFTASGLLVRFLKVFEKSGYQSVKWVRYLTKANGSYQIRVSTIWIVSGDTLTISFELDVVSTTLMNVMTKMHDDLASDGLCRAHLGLVAIVILTVSRRRFRQRSSVKAEHDCDRSSTESRNETLPLKSAESSSNLLFCIST